MKNVFITSLLFLLAISSCKNKETSKTTSDSEVQEVAEPSIQKVEETKAKEQSIRKFSWDDIQESTIDIGAYPYITPPKGIVVDNNTSDTESFDFHKLEMFDGNSFFAIEGPVEKMGFKMENDKQWNQYFFDKSVSEYLTAIGAKLVSDKKIPSELINTWGDTSNDQYEHMHKFYVGDVVNDKVRMYVLKTSTKRIGFQVYSSTASGEIGVVEMESFKQTIEKITADKMLSEINTNGFTTLHINFETGKSRIKPDSYETVNEIAKMMKNNPDLKISIEGHTDNVGNEELNLKLSKNRARSVLMALSDENIDESRLKSTGFGASKPVGDNATDEGKAKNRRVEIRKI